MGEQQVELTGPDLEAGVPLAELAEGELLLGHAHGEAGTYAYVCAYHPGMRATLIVR